MNRKTNNPARSRRERLRELVELAAEVAGVAVDFGGIDQAASRLARRPGVMKQLAALCSSCRGIGPKKQ